MNQSTNFDTASYVGIQSKRPPDSQRFPAAHAGWFLKRERLSRGLALNKVAAQLKVRERFLWAIEEGVDAEFPQATDFFSIVSAYAEYLEFDPTPLLEHYRQIMPAMLAAQKRGPGNIIALWPAMRARTQALALTTVVVVAAVVGASWWLKDDPSANGSKIIATIPAPSDLQTGKGKELAGQRADTSIATSSLSPKAANTLGQGSVQVHTMDLTEAMNRRPNPPNTSSRATIEAELDAAVAKHKAN